jgi:mono/diheme cytochrome c family protein
MTRPRTTTALALLAALALASGLAGCRGDRSDNPPRQFFPDMDDSPRWNPQGASEFFADGRTMRPQVPGAVAFGRYGFNPVQYADADWAGPFIQERQDLLREDDAYYRGTEGPDVFLDYIPIPVTGDLIRRGQERFNIYCAPCHGYAGDGRGMVGRLWSAPVASFYDEQFRDRIQRTGKDGYLFHVAMHGVGEPPDLTMPGYAHALNERDAWAIVAYIRALQATRPPGATLDDVPPDEREMLRRAQGGAQ